MRHLLLTATFAALAAGCVPKASPPPAAPVRTPPPAPTPSPPAPVPLAADWRDWPITPGDWRYAGGAASFGTGSIPLLSLRCDAGAIALTRAGTATSATVRASTTARTLPMTSGSNGSVARLPATDPLLDAIGFSRGRFVVESPGAAPLVVPANAEILRVIEDCRG
jgi:hypothetical protein